MKNYRVANIGRPKFSDLFQDGDWAGRRCFIIGGGPSLRGFDFERLRGRGRVIAINKAFYDAPFADIMMAMDRPLLDEITSGRLNEGGKDYRKSFAEFTGARLWLDLSGYSYPEGVYSMPSAGATGWSSSIKHGLVHGNNSGYAALNLALVLGANPIYLLGYDCSRGPAGEKNYHSGYTRGSSPDAMAIFKREIEAGAAALQAGITSRIVNLNPQSALRCFPFGDVDLILPPAAPAGDRITAVTLTGDRPLAFGLCRQWMFHQLRRPDQWVVVDDGKVPMEPKPGIEYVRRNPGANDPGVTLDLNMAAAIPHITGNKILIIEDDEYYAPGYVREMAGRMEAAEVVGICKSKYYHLPTGGYRQISNTGHASLAETGFRSSFLPTFKRIVDEGSRPRRIDDRLWQAVRDSGGGIKSQLFDDGDALLYVGMKGLPGRNGIGAGHKSAMYNSTDSPDRAQLRRWIPKDFQAYLDILAGMK